MCSISINKKHSMLSLNNMRQFQDNLTRKVFLLATLNLIQIFSGIRQLRMKARFKILAAEFKRESCKFALSNYTVGLLK